MREGKKGREGKEGREGKKGGEGKEERPVEPKASNTIVPKASNKSGRIARIGRREMPAGRPLPPPTRLYLVRHGETENARPRLYNGHRDVGLSPEGLRQAEEMAARLADLPIQAVYSSDLKRAIRGAEMIATRHGLEAHPDPEFREKSFGIWEGLTYEEVAARYPEQWERWLADPVESRPEGGESYREVADRAVRGLERVLGRHPGEEVVIVAHGGVNRVILCHALRLDLRHIFRVEQDFSALNVIDFYTDGTAVVKLVNG